MSPIKTLCLVDDDSIFRFLTQSVIKHTNLVNQVKAFANGLEALDFLKDGARQNPQDLPEVILLDLTMPVMDGWEFLEEYDRLHTRFRKKIPLYVVSSSISPADIEKSRAMNTVTDYIVKPITKDKVMDIISRMNGVKE